MKKVVILSSIALAALLGCTDNRKADKTTPSSAPTTTSRMTQNAPSNETSTTGLSDVSDADRALAQRIESDLRNNSTLAPAVQDIQVHAKNGEVTLRGSVNNEQEKANIGSAVQQMEGVSKVNNQIQITSASR